MSILVVTGPTAAGKTAVALQLAQQRPVRLISVDSAMVYRGMDIGTAKPDADTLLRYPHALVDICDPADPYTVSDFVADADREVAGALAAGELPVLVGGTMMYLKTFREGLDAVPRSTEAVREHVALKASRHGWQALHEELVRVDPVGAAAIHPNNPQRLARALEVYELCGRPISSFWGKAQEASVRHGVPLVEVMIDVEQRQELHRRISQRLDDMLQSGFVEEVSAFRTREDLHADLPSMRAVGYRQVWDFLDGVTGFDLMCEKVLAATRGLARRQYTWLRRWTHVQRFCGADPNELAGRLSKLVGD